MLAKYAIHNGGAVYPLILPYSLSDGTGVLNPSVYNDRGTLLVNIRHVNYVIYHCHSFFHEYGPLQYIHKESDRTLTTTNFLAEIGVDFALKNIRKVDTSFLDQPPQWNFIGLEDARLVRWEDKLYQIGVRRDTTIDGQGRMELSEISEGGVELSRQRIPAPGADDSYCEKNWMPVLDKPFTFIKWTNPTEVVSINKDFTVDSKITGKAWDSAYDYRGGSQVIPVDDYYLAVIHESILFNSELKQKDAVYRHRFIVWDEEFNFIKQSKQFSFLDGKIEFCCGLASYHNDFILSFGRQDNSAYLMKIPQKALKEFIWNS